MLNNDTIEILGELNAITNSVILKYPQTVAVSDSGDVLALIDLSVFDKEAFPDIGLKANFSEFLNLFKLMGEDKVVDVKGNVVNISSGDMSSTFITDVTALMGAYDKSPEQFVKTEQAPSVATFDLTVDDIVKIKTATGVFKDLSEVIYTSKDGDVKVSLGATNKFNAKSHTFSLTKPAQTTKEFEIKIPVENFKTLPQSEYTVEVKYNSAKDSYRILMINKSIAGFKLLMTVKI